MPGFSIEVPHELGQQQASGRLRGFLDKVRERYQSQVIDLEETWTENNLNFGFKTYGISVQGNVDVQPEAVKVAGKLPLAAIAFRGKIEQSIREELEKVLA